MQNLNNYPLWTLPSWALQEIADRLDTPSSFGRDYRTLGEKLLRVPPYRIAALKERVQSPTYDIMIEATKSGYRVGELRDVFRQMQFDGFDILERALPEMELNYRNTLRQTDSWNRPGDENSDSYSCNCNECLSRNNHQINTQQQQRNSQHSMPRRDNVHQMGSSYRVHEPNDCPQTLYNRNTCCSGQHPNIPPQTRQRHILQPPNIPIPSRRGSTTRSTNEEDFRHRPRTTQCPLNILESEQTLSNCWIQNQSLSRDQFTNTHSTDITSLSDDGNNNSVGRDTTMVKQRVLRARSSSETGVKKPFVGTPQPNTKQVQISNIRPTEPDVIEESNNTCTENCSCSERTHIAPGDSGCRKPSKTKEDGDQDSTYVKKPYICHDESSVCTMASSPPLFDRTIPRLGHSELYHSHYILNDLNYPMSSQNGNQQSKMNKIRYNDISAVVRQHDVNNSCPCRIQKACCSDQNSNTHNECNALCSHSDVINGQVPPNNNRSEATGNRPTCRQFQNVLGWNDDITRVKTIYNREQKYIPNTLTNSTGRNVLNQNTCDRQETPCDKRRNEHVFSAGNTFANSLGTRVPCHTRNGFSNIAARDSLKNGVSRAGSIIIGNRNSHNPEGSDEITYVKTMVGADPRTLSSALDSDERDSTQMCHMNSACSLNGTKAHRPVYVTYCYHDRPQVTHLFEALENNGIPFFSDHEYSFSDPQETLRWRENQMEEAAVIIVCLSPTYERCIIHYEDGGTDICDTQTHFLYKTLASKWLERGGRNEKVFPVKFTEPGWKDESIPVWLKNTIMYLYPENLKDLIDHIKNTADIT